MYVLTYQKKIINKQFKEMMEYLTITTGAVSLACGAPVILILFWVLKKGKGCYNDYDIEQW